MTIIVVKYKEKQPLQKASAAYSYYLTELVSRVLYAIWRSNHLSSLAITAKFKPYGSATMIRREQLVGTDPEDQGVASDRVYSGSMLP